MNLLKQYILSWFMLVASFYGVHAMENSKYCGCDNFLTDEQILDISGWEDRNWRSSTPIRESSYLGNCYSEEGKELFLLGVLCHKYSAEMVRKKAQELIAKDATAPEQEIFFEYNKRCDFYGICREVKERITIKELLNKKIQSCRVEGCDALYDFISNREMQRKQEEAKIKEEERIQDERKREEKRKQEALKVQQLVENFLKPSDIHR